MEYSQERVTTLHQLGEGPPPIPADALADTAVVVPLTERDCETETATRVFSELSVLDPGLVVVPIRASAGQIDAICAWLTGFDVEIDPLWCCAPGLNRTLAAAGLPTASGKGRDVWLALGVAAEHGRYVVVHDADARKYAATQVRRLLTPVTMGYAFAKGYYARVEDGQLYGRLCRLFYEPLLDALATCHDDPIVSYLGAFRYALAGECAMTADLARLLSPPPSWGLEVATLGDAFAHAGFTGTAQVDLGRHVHDHRPVRGESGLEGMSHEVSDALFRVLTSHGVTPEYDTITAHYRSAGERLIAQYQADATFNGLEYDRVAEKTQLDRYAEAIGPPGPDRRLPPWTDVSIDPMDVRTGAQPRRESDPVTRMAE